MRMITRIAAVVGLALVVVAAAACGGTQKSAAPPSSAAKPKPAAKAKARTTAAPPADTLHCVDVPRAVTRFILRGVVLDGAQIPARRLAPRRAVPQVQTTAEYRS